MYLPSPIRGKYCYLYLIEDIYSRKAVGWEVYDAESGEKAGALMKSVTLVSNMYELGIMGADRHRAVELGSRATDREKSGIVRRLTRQLP